MFGTGMHPYFDQVIQERLNPKPRSRVRPIQTAPVVKGWSVMGFVRGRIEAIECLLDRQGLRSCRPAATTSI